MDFCVSYETPTSGRILHDFIWKKEFDDTGGREHLLRYPFSVCIFLSNLVPVSHLLHNWKSFLVIAYS